MSNPASPQWKPIGVYRIFPFPVRPLSLPQPQSPPLTPEQKEAMIKRLYPTPQPLELPPPKTKFAFGRSF